MKRTFSNGVLLVVCGGLLGVGAWWYHSSGMTSQLVVREESGLVRQGVTGVGNREEGAAVPSGILATKNGSVAVPAFREWTQRYLEASVKDRGAMVEEGRQLAAARRPVFKEMIRKDARLALSEAVPMVVRQEMPSAVLELLEERVNERGALRVYQGVGLDNASPAETHRIAELANGRTYAAHVFGRRAESVLWLPNAAVNGVAVDTELAINEAPFRVLEEGERPDPDKKAVAVCPVSGKVSAADEQMGEPITEATPALEVYGEIVYLCDGSHTMLYGQTLIQGEGSTGGPVTFTGILPAAPTPSIGNVKVLVIPMTFADQNDTPSTESTLYNLMRNVGDHYAKASYGKLTLLSTVTPPVTLPHNEAWYVQKDSSNGGPIDGLGLEHSHARAEARKLGFDDDDYDCIVVRLRGGARPAGGWGGGRSVWIYGDGADVTAHEVGHVFGLAHANFWDTAGTSAIGTGTNGEYGGYYDVMGGFGLPNGHYNAQAKNQIRWLPADFVTETTTSGLYRIFAQDQAILDPAKRFALKIRKDNLRTYWGELRGVYTGNTTETWTDNGLILGWKYSGGGGNNIQLIDTTPGSSFGKTDSPISLGRTFSDTGAGIHLTTLAVHPATASEPKSVDVQVHFGDFPTNQAPTLALSVSASVVPVNVPVTFTATATDSDGDALAYSWQHFGDSAYRTISPNAAQISRTFTASGTYVVTCTASDMKGGTAVRNQLITVGNGGGKFTVSGRVTQDGEGLAGVIVNANSANGVITDSDGRYIIPNLTAATYIMTPLLYGYTFTELFNNSASVGPNFSGANFEAASTPVVTLTASVPVTTEGGATAGRFLLSRTGDAAQALVVNVTSLSGTSAAADYGIAPALAAGSQGLSTLTIPAGADQLEVVVTPVNDTAMEGPETLVLTAAAGNGYLVGGNASATVTIDDNDTALPRVGLVIGQAKASEGGTLPATIRVRRSGAVTAALTVVYSISGTATAGTDYPTLTGSVVVPAGAAEGVVSILPLNDNASETIETVGLTLTANAAYVTDPTALNAVVSIVDDDLQILRVVASDAVATERDLRVLGTVADTGTFFITREGDTTLPLTVYYAVAGSTSGTTATALHGVDYEALPGVLVIPAGQSSGAVTILPRWDGLGEAPESVRIQLGAGPTNYQLGPDNTATITINDAGDPVYVEVITVDNAGEGNTPTVGKFRFSLKGSSAAAVTVNYVLSGTAASGTDYTALPGSVSIPGSGLNTVEVNVTPVNDALLEDLESVILTITPGAAYQIYPASATALMQLRDDEGPTVYVDASDSDYPPAIAENSSGGPFYLSRTGSTTAALTVNYTMSGSAIAGTDYAAVSGSAVIPAGANGVDVAITPINDALAEGVETVTLTLAAGAYSRTPSATYYLTDDESPAVTVAFQNQSAAAVESVGTVTIPVTLNGASVNPVTVEYLVDRSAHDTASATGTALSVLPYWVRTERVGNTFTGSISPDGITWTVVSTETIPMSSASYQAGLAVCSFATASASTATFDNVTVTGLDVGGTQGARTGANMGTPAVTGASSLAGSVYTVSGAGDNVEGTTDQGYFTWWPITNSANCTVTARVLTQTNPNALATAGVMIREVSANNAARNYMAATPGSGFEHHVRTALGGTDTKTTRTGGSALWLRLQRTGAFVSVFQSSNGTNWSQVGANQALAMGTEVEAGLALSSFSDASVATARFDNLTVSPGSLPVLQGRTIGLSGTQGTDAVAGGIYDLTAAGDGFSGTGDDGYLVTGPVSGDFVMSVRLVSTTGPSSLRAGLILRQTYDRESRMAFIGSVAAGTPQFLWRHTSTNTAFGTGIDFTLPTGLLTFPAGTTLQNISLPLVDDTIPEPDETVIVVLRNPNGARLGTTTQFAQVIADDDSPPLLASVGFSAASGSVEEKAGIEEVAVSLSAAPAVAVTVDYAITAGTAQGGTDFVVETGTLTFAPGQTVAMIEVNLLDDAVVESSETLSVTLNGPSGIQLGSLVSHTLTLTDNDSPVVTVTSADSSGAESGDTATATFTRSGPVSNALTLNYSRTGTAAVGDYTGLSGMVVIPAGQASATATLTPVQDTTSEGSETVILTLTAGSYVIGTPGAATLTILDDDRNAVSILATTGQAVEGGAAGQFTVARTGSTAASLSVVLTVTGTATATTDYTTNPGTVTTLVLSAGQASRTIAVTPVNDAAIEGDEVVIAQLGAGAYDVSDSGYASVTVVDNDIPPTVFISSPGAQGVVVAPGNGLRLTATMADDGLPLAATATWSQVTGPGPVVFTGAVSTTGEASAVFPLPGTYLLRVTAFDGQFSVSDQVSVTVGAPAVSRLADWIGADIGPPTLRGYSGASGSNWFLNGSGVGYGTNSDRAHAITRTVSGNGTIVARLTALQANGQAGAEAGLSVRDSLHRYARRAVLSYTGSTRTLRFRHRVTNNTVDAAVSLTNLDLPLWLKLDRIEGTDTVTASYAPDAGGAPGAWVAVGVPVVVAMDAGAIYSLTCASGSDTAASSATFDQLALTPAAAGAGEVVEDFGDGTQTGTYSYTAGTDLHVMNGQPGGLDSKSIFRGQSVTGDFMLTVLQLDATSGAANAYSGVMIRDTMDDGPMAFVGRNPFSAYSSFIWRTNAKGGTSGLNGISQKTRWLRLIRRGNQITALHAANNAGVPGAWAQLGQPRSVFLEPTVLAGLSVCNGDGVGMNTAQFTKLSLVPLHPAPVVNAGSVTGTATSPLNVSGTVTDDGLPAPLTVAWSAPVSASPVSFANAAALATTASFTTPGDYTLRLTAADGMSTVFDDLAFNNLSPFLQWQTARFPGGAAFAESGAEDDPDKDGLSNLLEYGLGGDPMAPHPDAVVHGAMVVGGASYFTMTVPKNPAATDAVVTVEAGSSLAADAWSGAGLVVVSSTPETLIVRDSEPTANRARRFYRVRVAR